MSQTDLRSPELTRRATCRMPRQLEFQPLGEISLQICCKCSDVKQSTQFIVVSYISRYLPTSHGENLDISMVIRHPAIPPLAGNP